MLCCGNIRCIFCSKVMKKEIEEYHRANCRSNPANQKEETTLDPYYCTKCLRYHKDPEKGIGKDHLKFKGVEPEAVPVELVPDEPLDVEEEPLATEGMEDEEAPVEVSIDPELYEEAPVEVSIDPELYEEAPVEVEVDAEVELSVGSDATPELEVDEEDDGTDPAAPEDLCGFYLIEGGCNQCQGRGNKCLVNNLKILDHEICKTSRSECLTRDEGLEAGVRSTCPYYGLPPEGRSSCSGVWCYSRNRQVRVPKTCKKFEVNCPSFGGGRWHGVPYHKVVN